MLILPARSTSSQVRSQPNPGQSLLLPALESGALLAHPDTYPSAAGLLAALAEHHPELAGRLEAAVQRAHALADANGGSEQMKDALSGCLKPDVTTSAALTDGLDKLGPDDPPGGCFKPGSIVDELAEQGVELEAPVAAAARALSEELNVVRSSADNRPQAERRLLELFTEADAAFAASASLPSGLQRLLVDSAAALARDRRVLPGTPLGDRILAVLTTAVSSPDAGRFLG